MEEETFQKTILELVAEFAEFANAVASMVVGHRRILVEGDFDINLADQMAAALHAQVLGLVHQWTNDEDEMDVRVLEFLVSNDEDEEDE